MRKCGCRLGTTDCADDADRGTNKTEGNEKTKSYDHLVAIDGLAFIFFVISCSKKSFGEPPKPIRGPRVLPRHYFGAREATIFSKHGSPRRGSHNGISFNSP
jgi:hypothetical protein